MSTPGYIDCTTGYTTEGSQFDFAQGQPIFLSSEASLPILGHTQSLIRWVPEISGRGVNLAPHHRLVPRLRMSGGILPLPSYALVACLRTTSHFLHFTWISPIFFRIASRKKTNFVQWISISLKATTLCVCDVVWPVKRLKLFKYKI